MTFRRTDAQLTIILAAMALSYSTGRADIAPSQTLVVYNAASADGTALKDVYLAAHPDIPAANVVALNSSALMAPDVSYDNFANLMRNPIRAHLQTSGNPTAEDIIAIVLIRPLPHRLMDENTPSLGDNPNGLLNVMLAGNANCGSIDAEVALLWQNNRAGEANGAMDSRLDNMIDNPYHTLTASASTFSRANITTQKFYTNAGNAAWVDNPSGGVNRLLPGQIYMVSRIDGHTLADATALVQRSQDIVINKAAVKILLDEYNVSVATFELDNSALFTSGDPFNAGDDYEQTRDFMSGLGWDVHYDGTFDFIESSEETAPLIAYCSYGENHALNGWGQNPPGSATYIDNFNLKRGAVFNTIESYNARAFNGLPAAFVQEQIADFIAAGGTFGIGCVWEPTSVFVPDNRFLLANLLREGGTNLTWGEAAFSAMPALSWMVIAVGDPIARPIIVNDPSVLPGDLNGDGLVDGEDIGPMVQLVLNGVPAYHASFPTLDPIGRGDFTGDQFVTQTDLTAFTNALLNP